MSKLFSEAKRQQRLRLRIALNLRKTIMPNGRPMTFASIAEKLGVTSRERARQLVRQAEIEFKQKVK